MSQKTLLLCGIASPILFIFMIILGAELSLGYSHITNTVSELLTSGAPNKPLLGTIHILSALLSILFGVGIFQLIHDSEFNKLIGLIGAGLLITNGLINMITTTIFPQDAWGSPATFAGEMHKLLVAILVLLSIFSTILLGIWFQSAGFFPRFRIYSFITVGLMLISGLYAMTKLGTPIMGLTERISIIVSLQWTFFLALKLFLTQAKEHDEKVI